MTSSSDCSLMAPSPKMERALVCGAAAKRVCGRPSDEAPRSAPAPAAAATGAGAAAAGRTGMGGRDLRGAGLLLRGGRAGGGGGERVDLGGFLSNEATSRSKASAAGGATDGLGLRRFGFEMGRRERGDSSESRSDF